MWLRSEGGVASVTYAVISRRLTGRMENRLTLCPAALRAAFVFLAAGFARGEPPTFKEALVIGPVGPGVRSIVAPDAVAKDLVAGTWAPPKAGDTISLPDGNTRTWEAVEVGAEGKIERPSLTGGYAYVPVESDVDQVVLLSASGQGLVYVNGEPRAGDPYSLGFVRVPVALKAGRNDVLFRGGRGGIQFSLKPVESTLTIDTADATMPDVVEGVGGEFLGSTMVINASREWIRGASIVAAEEGGKPTTTAVPALPPLSVFKAAFAFQVAPRQGVPEVRVLLQVTGGDPNAPRTGTEAFVSIRVRKPDDSRRITFKSAIDGSVQYYGLRPAVPAADNLGLVLSLHGASVQGQRQAEGYKAKDWANIVCPTNRRPYGFDWEDWGRLDAMEVLSLAREALKPDAHRVYVTGHSMGGHGSWQLAAHFPGTFAATAPSAGWISFWTYSGAEAYTGGSPLDTILKRAASASDTLALIRNYAGHGVYILHGDQDESVPVGQARQMRAKLGEFHADFTYYERPGARHWWGDECMDWPPLMEFLKARARPESRDVRRVEFATAQPGISATCDWLTIEAQTRPMMTSSVNITLDAASRSFSGPTQNVSRLTLDLGPLAAPRTIKRGEQSVEERVLEPGKPLTIELDQQKLADVPWPSAEPRITLYREGDQWRVGGWAPATLKGPFRSGPFKDAFRNAVVLVIGTGGTDEERAITLARARFDSESFWYRGNASLPIVLDKDFDVTTDVNRNVILYGNADTNTAWKALVGDSPVQVAAGKVVIGDRTIDGVDLACLFVRPRPGSDRASVGVIAGTGPVGMRLTQRIPYFQSGVGVPDWIVLGAEATAKGIGGIRGTGFFGNDWSLSPDDSGWADPPKPTP